MGKKTTELAVNERRSATCVLVFSYSLPRNWSVSLVNFNKCIMLTVLLVLPDAASLCFSIHFSK